MLASRGCTGSGTLAGRESCDPGLARNLVLNTPSLIHGEGPRPTWVLLLDPRSGLCCTEG